ncbi:MAG: (4Fe-4S)-binding protein [Acidobacteriota bacterium]
MKEYKNNDLVIFWYPDLCSHAGKCFGICPDVFIPQERPWIKIDAAPAEDIIKAIDKCPSGALKYVVPDGSCVDPELAKGVGSVSYDTIHPTLVRVRVVRNGPLILDGPMAVTDIDGAVIKEGSKLTLCRCGLSGNRPFCDNTHFKQGWKVDPKPGEAG